MFDPKVQQMRQEQEQGGNPLLVGGPGMETPPQGAIDAPIAAPMQSLFAQSPQEVPAQQKLMDALKKLNVDPKGIDLSKLGKFNFTAKMQKRYGEGFQSVTGVRDVLSMFDKHLDSMDGKLSEAKQSNVADRTLAALGQL